MDGIYDYSRRRHSAEEQGMPTAVRGTGAALCAILCPSPS